ncbi:histidine phosphatase family protein [Paenibacillus chartarius]|uniref:Histidine phosphatase family protein n=1 Tax=Paenibacillus chartarius TaxID=747481 RepID=A0ABV6DQA8_9BACL
MKLGFVRHGTTTWNQEGRLQGQIDTELTEEGRRQAIRLGMSLRGGPWQGIVCSDLKRAKETAELIAGHAGIPLPGADRRLREKSFGEMEGTTLEERVSRWGPEWRQADLGQETDEAVWARWMDFYENVLLRQYGDKPILVVTHGAFIARILQFKGLERKDQLLVNSSLTVLRRSGDVWETELYNDVGHLTE